MKISAWKYLCFLFIAALLSSVFGCRAQPSPNAAPTKKALLFIPGYKGSTLNEKRGGSSAWISSGNVIFGSRPLTLPVPGAELSHSRELVATDVINSVSVIPLLYKVHIYDNFLEVLHQRLDSSTKVVEFAYDWRLDTHDVVIALDKKINQLRAEGITQIDVLAHSMGGLSLAYYMRYGTQDFENATENWSGAAHINNAAFLAVPFGGSVSIFDDFNHGNKVIWNDDLLNREAISSFPAAYQLLPYPGDDVFTKADGLFESGFLFDVESWRKNRWGMFGLGDAPNAAAAAARYEFVKTQLARAKKLTQLLTAPASAKPADNTRTKILAVTGRGLSSASGCEYYRASGDFVCPSERAPDLPGRVKEGDGVIVAESGELPAAFSSAFGAEKTNIRGEHLDMLNSEVLQRKLWSFIGAE